MDTGKLNNNTMFFDGFEDEPSISLTSMDSTITVWEGYVEDILDEPYMNREWKGFTKDYNEMIRTFGDINPYTIESPAEYLSDLQLYEEKEMDFEESTQVLHLLIEFLSLTVVNHSAVVVNRQ